MAYNKEVFNKVKNDFREKYDNDWKKAKDREEVLHRISPELRKIDDDISKLGFEIFGETVKGKKGIEDRIAVLKEKNEKLLERRKEVIKSLGYPSDYTDVKYECEKCGDTGIYNNRYCECFLNALSAENYKRSGLGNLMKTQSFENFDLSFYSGDEKEEMKYNLSTCKAYVDKFDGTECKNLFLRGNTGLGKTHLTTSVSKGILDKGYDVVYEVSQNIFNSFEDERFNRDKEVDTEKYFDCELLIIDDLGSEMATSFTVSCLYNLLNARLNNGLSTVISSNLTWEEIRRIYSDRVCSRLLGNFIPLEFNGVDVRMQKLSK